MGCLIILPASIQINTRDLGLCKGGELGAVGLKGMPSIPGQ